MDETVEAVHQPIGILGLVHYVVGDAMHGRAQDYSCSSARCTWRFDNAITRLHRSGVTSVVRLSSRDESVDPEAVHMLLSNKLRAWAAEVGARSRGYVGACSTRRHCGQASFARADRSRRHPRRFASKPGRPKHWGHSTTPSVSM